MDRSGGSTPSASVASASDEWETVPRRGPSKPAWGNQERSQPSSLGRTTSSNSQVPSTPSRDRDRGDRRASDYGRSTPKSRDRGDGDRRDSRHTPDNSSRRDLAAETFNSEDGPENKQSLKKEASSVVRSLSASHDVAEAVSQIRELKPSQRN